MTPLSSVSLLDLALVVWQRRIWILLPIVAGLAVGLLAAQLLPRTYRASTLILVEPQKIPNDYVKSTVTSSLQERLKTIEQQITNRTNLERIVQEADLHSELVSRGGLDEAVRLTRNALGLEIQGTSVFRISFADPNAGRAAATANRVADLFIQENLKLRERQAEGTTTFLETEMEAARLRLEEQEARIAGFKVAHMGELPEQRETNLRGVEQAQAKLQITLDAIDKAELRRMLLQRELPAWTEPGGAIAGISRVATLERELLDLRGRYTERHPDVIRVEQELAALEAEEARRGPAEAAAPTMIEDPRLRIELQTVELELANLRDDRSRILADIETYQRRLERIPQVESELLGLTRDYENVQRSYNSLQAKKIDARLAENLERQQQSEQFIILEPAVAPSEPYSPDWRLTVLMGIGAGCALGLALALLRHQVDQSFLDAAALQTAFPGVAVLAEIPQMRIREPHRRSEGQAAGEGV